MSNSTPGPWTIEQDDAFQGMPFIPIFAPSGDIGEKRICEVAPELLADGTFAITDETRANARLIVAVPELLSVLRKWRDAPMGGHGQRYVGDDLIDATDALIAKATGA